MIDALPDPAKGPRVLRIITRLNVGGPARQAAWLHHRLPELGLIHRLVTGVEEPGEGWIDPGTAGVTEISDLRRPIDPRADRRAFLALQRLTRSWQPDLVHTHLAKAGALGRVAARRARVPATVHTFHGHVLDGYFHPALARTFVEVERRLARRTDALVAVSPEIRDELLDLGIGRPPQWRVIPVGLDLASLLAPGPDPAAARARLGLPAAGPVVGIVGRLTAIKDHATFLAAAARILETHPGVTFAVAGDGPSRADVDAAAAKLGERVVMLGWVQDLPALYAALDVVALSSRNEGTPVSLIEAGAARRPVVSTRVGGVPQVVVDGETGLLVPAQDAAAFAGAVGALLDDPARAAAMGAAGRAHVRERFDAERLARDLIELYEELLGRRAAGDRPPE